MCAPPVAVPSISSLYTFSDDTHAGQLGGEGFRGAWYALSPAGQRVVMAGGEKPAQGYLISARGRR